MAAYERSPLLRYLEEVLAETYAQLRVNGIRGMPAGIRFPIENGYVTLTAVLNEAAIGTIAVGNVTYYVVLDLAGEGCHDQGRGLGAGQGYRCGE